MLDNIYIIIVLKNFILIPIFQDIGNVLIHLKHYHPEQDQEIVMLNT